MSEAFRVTYAAPTRAHHYPYAEALHRAGILKAFVSGYPRFSSRARCGDLGELLVRRDWVQCLYLAALRVRGIPRAVTDGLGEASRRFLDYSSTGLARNSDLFLAYNGCGLHTHRALRGTGVTRVVEMVTSHMQHQEDLLVEEHRRCGLPYGGIHGPQKRRRIQEYGEADYILCPSTFVQRSFLEAGFPSRQLLLNTYGLPAPISPTAKVRSSERFLVLYVGSINVRKGVRYLLEAFARFQHPHKELWIVGPKSSPNGIDDVAIPDGVSFHGVLKGEALQAAYAEAQAFVLPSVEDGFGLVMGEAMSHGVPVIATTNTGAADLFSDGKEGFIVPIRDPAAIAERLQLLADEPARREELRQAVAQRARNAGGWEESGRRLSETLVNLKPLA